MSECWPQAGIWWSDLLFGTIPFGVYHGTAGSSKSQSEAIFDELREDGTKLESCLSFL